MVHLRANRKVLSLGRGIAYEVEKRGPGAKRTAKRSRCQQKATRGAADKGEKKLQLGLQSHACMKVAVPARMFKGAGASTPAQAREQRKEARAGKCLCNGGKHVRATTYEKRVHVHKTRGGRWGQSACGNHERTRALGIHNEAHQLSS